MLIKIVDQSIPGKIQNSIEIELDEITTPKELLEMEKYYFKLKII